MSINVGAQVAIILLAYGPCVVIVNLLGQVCTLGRAPRTKETFPDFQEWCRVTRHSRVFYGLTGCQRTPRFWGVTKARAPLQLVDPLLTTSPTTTHTHAPRAGNILAQIFGGLGCKI